MQICKLCNLPFPELENSHIISECFYKYLYDKKHRYVPISNEVDEQLEMKQKGFTEKLLCKACENKFSKWENILSKDFEDIGKMSSSYLTISTVKADWIKVEGIRFNEFKRGLLSIFWRASISSLKVFRNYKFGPYNERIREILFNDKPLSAIQYPILMKMGTLEGNYAEGVMMFYPRGKFNIHSSVYRMTISGFDFTLYMTEDKFPSQAEKILIGGYSSLYFMKFRIEDVLSGGGVLDRFGDDDVIKIMSRLK